MKIFFINDSIRGIVSKEETFWSILSENISGAKGIPLNNFSEDISEYIKREGPDIVVVNAIIPGIIVSKNAKKIVLLQDNFVEMRKFPLTFRSFVKAIITLGKGTYAAKAKIQKKSLQTADVVVAVSRSVADSYECKTAKIIPIGTDTDLFKPLPNKNELKTKYGLPQDKKVKIFIGSIHPVKGFDILKKEILQDKNSFYILVLKDNYLPRYNFENAKIFQKISQDILAELINCADVCVGRSRVETLWLGPIEAMFCGIPVDVTPVGIFADWTPENKDPRKEAFEKGLDRETMIKRWENLFSELSEKSG